MKLWIVAGWVRAPSPPWQSDHRSSLCCLLILVGVTATKSSVPLVESCIGLCLCLCFDAHHYRDLQTRHMPRLGSPSRPGLENTKKIKARRRLQTGGPARPKNVACARQFRVSLLRLPAYCKRVANWRKETQDIAISQSS